MEQKHNITDEQIARFIGGTATKEENDAILEYMSQSDEHVDELMAIAEAVQAQRNSNQAAKRSNNRAVAWRIAASVAVILIAGGIWYALRDHGVAVEPQAGNTVALNTIPTPAPVAPDATDESNSGTSVVDPTVVTPSTNRPSSDQIAQNTPTPSSDKPINTDKSSSERTKTNTTVSGTEEYLALQERVDANDNPRDMLDTRFDIVFRKGYAFPTSWKSGSDITVWWNCNAWKIDLMMRPKGSNKWTYSDVFYQDRDKAVIAAATLEKLVAGANVIEWRMEAHFRDREKTTVKTGKITVEK